MSRNFLEKICIVGAGISGLSVAWFLKEKGYKNITVLEKSERLGGKCHSPRFKGRTYEMGAAMGDEINYNTILDIMEKLNFKGDGPKLNAKIFNHINGEELVGITQEEKPLFQAQLAKMKHLLETKYKGYNLPGHANTHEDLKETFYDFCMMNEVPLCLKVWLNPFTSFGYGYFNLIPAAYVLQYIDWDTVESMFSKKIMTWSEGTEIFCERIAESLDQRPRLNTSISKIERKNNKVYIYTEFGKEEYDKIIFTSPLQDLHDYVDIDDDEKELFEKIITNQYNVYSCTVENFSINSGYYPKNMVQSRAGHVMFYLSRWKDDPEQILTFYILGDSSQNIGDKECRALLEEDLRKFNINLRDVILHKTWRYFPHINSTEMKNGWYEKLEGKQGNLNTFYAGEIMSFSNLEECASYSKTLVKRFF
ncbi:FAD-dependent oxidoreductase [Clostridium sp. KNHs214]|uniref:FAD-dependent oxidoreductase n=1 Tax=Clostridium sp. KNHs214 TaxID=1540257 RepID=UPI00055188CB|nr:FAD-dependent oxidoreductase [Clostridium sp. KNHs214]